MNRWLGTINHASITVSDLEGELAQRSFVLYQPGLHHVAFNSDSHARVDALAALVGELGGTILDGSGEFPFGVGGYYAVYFRGPDGLKFEFVHMPALAACFG